MGRLVSQAFDFQTSEYIIQIDSSSVKGTKYDNMPTVIYIPDFHYGISTKRTAREEIDALKNIQVEISDGSYEYDGAYFYSFSKNFS